MKKEKIIKTLRDDLCPNCGNKETIILRIERTLCPISMRCANCRWWKKVNPTNFSIAT
jgi:predicted RNA-binding Zn-ribbon protein involved in translation (DUF1610 family)